MLTSKEVYLDETGTLLRGEIFGASRELDRGVNMWKAESQAGFIVPSSGLNQREPYFDVKYCHDDGKRRQDSTALVARNEDGYWRFEQFPWFLTSNCGQNDLNIGGIDINWVQVQDA